MNSSPALLETIFEKFVPYTVTHMCHDMTSLAIRAFRLGASTFCLPLAGIAWPSFGLNRVRSVPSTSDGGWTIPLQPKKNKKSIHSGIAGTSLSNVYSSGLRSYAALFHSLGEGGVKVARK